MSQQMIGDLRSEPGRALNEHEGSRGQGPSHSNEQSGLLGEESGNDEEGDNGSFSDGGLLDRLGMGPDEMELEDMIWTLLTKTGTLSKMKTELTDFIMGNTNLVPGEHVISNKADSRILSAISEYLSWIGMHRTVVYLLSESPVCLDQGTLSQNRGSDDVPEDHEARVPILVKLFSGHNTIQAHREKSHTLRTFQDVAQGQAGDVDELSRTRHAHDSTHQSSMYFSAQNSSLDLGAKAEGESASKATAGINRTRNATFNIEKDEKFVTPPSAVKEKFINFSRGEQKVEREEENHPDFSPSFECDSFISAGSRSLTPPVYVYDEGPRKSEFMSPLENEEVNRSMGEEAEALSSLNTSSQRTEDLSLMSISQNRSVFSGPSSCEHVVRIRNVFDYALEATAGKSSIPAAFKWKPGQHSTILQSLGDDDEDDDEEVTNPPESYSDDFSTGGSSKSKEARILELLNPEQSNKRERKSEESDLLNSGESDLVVEVESSTQDFSIESNKDLSRCERIINVNVSRMESLCILGLNNNTKGKGVIEDPERDLHESFLSEHLDVTAGQSGAGQSGDPRILGSDFSYPEIPRPADLTYDKNKSSGTLPSESSDSEAKGRNLEEDHDSSLDLLGEGSSSLEGHTRDISISSGGFGNSPKLDVEHHVSLNK